MVVPKLTFATFNVNSLGQGTAGVHKRNAIRELFSHLSPKPDILMLQEHM